MSSIRFEDLSRLRPELAPVWRELLEWQRKNPKVRVFDLTRLAREVRVSPSDLLTAFVILVNLGMVRQVFQVKEPVTRVLQGEDFGDPDEVPPILRDRSDRAFSTEDCEIVPVFREVEAVGTANR